MFQPTRPRGARHLAPAGAGLVNPNRVAGDPPLELIGVLTQIVQQACQMGQSVGGKRRGVSSSNLRNRFQMLTQGLPIRFVGVGRRMSMESSSVNVHVEPRLCCVMAF